MYNFYILSNYFFSPLFIMIFIKVKATRNQCDFEYYVFLASPK